MYWGCDVLTLSAVLLLTLFSILYLWLVWAYFKVGRSLLTRHEKTSESFISQGHIDVSRICKRRKINIVLHEVSL